MDTTNLSPTTLALIARLRLAGVCQEYIEHIWLPHRLYDDLHFDLTKDKDHRWSEWVVGEFETDPDMGDNEELRGEALANRAYANELARNPRHPILPDTLA